MLFKLGTANSYKTGVVATGEVWIDPTRIESVETTGLRIADGAGVYTSNQFAARIVTHGGREYIVAHTLNEIYSLLWEVRRVTHPNLDEFDLTT